MLFDVSRETRRFYNNPFVSRETLVLLHDVPRMSMVSRGTQGGVVKLLVMVFENSFSCRC